jgi:hypothetical protein
MKRALLGAMALWMIAAWLVGCEDNLTVGPGEARCRGLCESSKACLTPEEARRVDCFKSCDEIDVIARANECYDELDLFYDCIDRHGVCSDLETECEDEEDVLSDCFAEQCSTDPDRDICL